jgi:hypothetical protein
MRARPLLPFARSSRWWLACSVATALALAVCSSAPAEDPPARTGPSYRNESMGIRLQGPQGWKMATSSQSAPVAWMPLVTFYDPPTDTDVTLSVRPRKSSGVKELSEALQKEWSSDKSFTVMANRIVEPTPLRPLASVWIEATQTVTPPAPATPKPPPAVPPPPPAAVQWYVTASYWLAPGYEYLLYGKARSTVWSRMRPLVEAVRDSFTVAGASAGPEGEGAFHDDLHAFACKYPKGYSVRIPQRKNHLVEFQGVSADAPVLGVYGFTAEHSVEDDVRTLVTYYTEEQGGEASTGPVEVSGGAGTLVTARASVGGKEQTFLIAVVKRGATEFFRVRAAMPRTAEAEGKRVFDLFLRSFRVGAPPK